MNKNDKFLKVEVTAYFPISNLNITQVHDPNNEELSTLHLNGKPISLELLYTYLNKNGESTEVNELQYDSISVGETFVTREEIWEEDPTQKIFDEILEKKKLT